MDQRDCSRLLVLRRDSGAREHRRFADVTELLRSGDALVVNNSRVIPARLRARKVESPGRLEVFMAEEAAPSVFWALLRPGKRVRTGTRLQFLDREGRLLEIRATVEEKSDDGLYRLSLDGRQNVRDVCEQHGEVPLPPYISRPAQSQGVDDFDRYQTVFAGPPGSVAAPTAGLHFTPRLLETLRGRGLEVIDVTLHVGLGTFAPVKTDDVEAHRIHRERFEIAPRNLERIQAARREGRRVVAVGTTSLRVLESVARLDLARLESRSDGEAVRGATELFVYPPFDFKLTDVLITNFHLPRSSLLMLVSAFASPGALDGRERILEAYREAIALNYRFFSYGDAMMIV